MYLICFPTSGFFFWGAISGWVIFVFYLFVGFSCCVRTPVIGDSWPLSEKNYVRTYNQVTRITYARPVRQEEKIHLNAIADMHSLGCGEKETPPIHIYMYTYPAAVR